MNEALVRKLLNQAARKVDEAADEVAYRDETLATILDIALNEIEAAIDYLDK